MDEAFNHAFQLTRGKDNASVKQGQSEIQKLRTQINYPLALLSFMSKTQMEPQLQAAVEVKLWCQSYKIMEQYQRNVYSQIIKNVKETMVQYYFNFSKQISLTLKPGIIALSEIQFPDKWQNLFPDIMNATKSNPNYIERFLQLAFGITEKYSILGRSDPLYKEINMVCDQLHDYLLKLAIEVFPACKSGDQNSLKILYGLLRVFYNLNYQDLHPKFEENLSSWMNLLGQTLKMGHRNPQDQSFKCKGAALESVLLYTGKYKEDVQNDIKSFSSSIWELCAKAGDDQENDEVVMICLKYFKSLVLWQDMKQFFTNNLEALISNLIIPNITPNQNTRDLFLQQNETYISYNFRNAEIGTRTSAAVDLLRTISRHFPKAQIFLGSQMHKYIESGSKNEINTMAILTLLIEGCSKAFRDADGTTQLFQSNEKIVVDGYMQIVKPQLIRIYQSIMANQGKPIQSYFNPLFLSTILRYLYYFRIFLSKDQIPLIVKLCCSLNTGMEQLSNVYHTVLVGFLTIKHGNFMMHVNLVPYFNSENIQPLVIQILQMIHRDDQILNKIDYGLAHCLDILSKTLGPNSVKFYQYIEALFTSMLKKTIIYDFKSAASLFQAIGRVTYQLLNSKSNAAARLQQLINDNFFVALKSQSDLLNFYLQLLSLFAFYNPSQKLGPYSNIYQSILNSENWSEQNVSVMSSYIKYITIYTQRQPKNLLQNKDKMQIIMAKLVSLDRFDLLFRLIDSILFITGLQGFYNSGYLVLAVNATQAIAGKSVQALKTCLIFFFKLTFFYPTKQAIGYISAVDKDFFFNLLRGSHDIIKGMQNRTEKCLMYSALCRIINEGLINNNELLALVMNSLIQNSAGRFNRDSLLNLVKNHEQQQKREGSFQKLEVLKYIQGGRTQQFGVQQDALLLQTYQFLNNNCPNVMNMIQERNQERMIRIHQRSQAKRL